MDRQLIESGLSETRAALPVSGAGMPEMGIQDEDLHALLAGAEYGLLERPVSRRAEVAARITARLLIDVLAVFTAATVAYWLRFENSFFVRAFPPEEAVFYGSVIAALMVTSPVLFLALKVAGMYDPRTRVRILDRIPRIVGATNAYLVFLLVMSFFLDSSVSTRGYLIVFWALAILCLFTGRMILQLSLRVAGINDVVMRNTLIVGAGKVGKQVARKLVRHEAFGLRPVGFVDDDPLFRRFQEPELKDLRVLGGIANLQDIIREFEVEKVIIAFSGTGSEQLLDLASRCNRAGVECSIVPRLFEVITDEIKVNEIGGIPLIKLRDKKITGYRKLLKDLEDYVLAAAALLITWPLLLITAIAIKLDSPGPVFFRQERVGKNQRTFTCLKFRSMVVNAEELQDELIDLNQAEGPLFKISDDPRVTRVGKWIRKFSIDELPQIFNVLAGHMSLVGPRPPVPREVKEYKFWQTQRLNVKPGITGLWQVSGRSDLPFDEMVKLDLYYIETWSLWQDFKIILRTFSAILSSNGAY